MFITFEGLDFSGKSTQVELFANRLSQENLSVLVLREPGGTEIGEKIRPMLLDKKLLGMASMTELFLFSASRAQLVEEVIRPALAAGMVVVCDRFYDSTTAYQGWGRGIDLDSVKAINAAAAGGLIPDITFFLDVPIDELERRLRRGQAGKDRMESSGVEFYRQVREGYLALAKVEQRLTVIDGTQPVDLIQEMIWERYQLKQNQHPPR